MICNRYKAKLQSEKGESISETLIALLISSLALLMLAGAVTAGTRVITESVKKMDTYYVNESNMVNRIGSSPIGIKIVLKASGPEETFTLSNLPISVQCCNNDTFGHSIVYSYYVDGSST